MELSAAANTVVREDGVLEELAAESQLEDSTPSTGLVAAQDSPADGDAPASSQVPPSEADVASSQALPPTIAQETPAGREGVDPGAPAEVTAPSSFPDLPQEANREPTQDPLSTIAQERFSEPAKDEGLDFEDEASLFDDDYELGPPVETGVVETAAAAPSVVVGSEDEPPLPAAVEASEPELPKVEAPPAKPVVRKDCTPRPEAGADDTSTTLSADFDYGPAVDTLTSDEGRAVEASKTDESAEANKTVKSADTPATEQQSSTNHVPSPSPLAAVVPQAKETVELHSVDSAMESGPNVETVSAEAGARGSPKPVIRASSQHGEDVEAEDSFKPLSRASSKQAPEVLKFIATAPAEDLPEQDAWEYRPLREVLRAQRIQREAPREASHRGEPPVLSATEPSDDAAIAYGFRGTVEESPPQAPVSYEDALLKMAELAGTAADEYRQRASEFEPAPSHRAREEAAAAAERPPPVEVPPSPTLSEELHSRAQEVLAGVREGQGGEGPMPGRLAASADGYDRARVESPMKRKVTVEIGRTTVHWRAAEGIEQAARRHALGGEGRHALLGDTKGAAVHYRALKELAAAPPRDQAWSGKEVKKRAAAKGKGLKVPGALCGAVVALMESTGSGLDRVLTKKKPNREGSRWVTTIGHKVESSCVLELGYSRQSGVRISVGLVDEYTAPQLVRVLHAADPSGPFQPVVPDLSLAANPTTAFISGALATKDMHVFELGDDISVRKFLRLEFLGFVSPLGSCHAVYGLRVDGRPERFRRPLAFAPPAVDATLPTAVADPRDPTLIHREREVAAPPELVELKASLELGRDVLSPTPFGPRRR